MASAVPLTMMWEEVTCSICLDPMVEPMSIECGHSFCQGCISEVGKEGGSVCPVCRRWGAGTSIYQLPLNPADFVS